MKKLLSMTAIVAVFACTTMSAFADDYSGESGVSLRLGAAFPTQSATRNNSADYWVAGGVDFRIGETKLVKHAGNLSISMDYTGKGNFRNMPLLLNFTSGKAMYFSVGVGAGFTRFTQDDGATNDKVRFAYSAAIGYNFNTTGMPTFFEVRYLGNDQPRAAAIATYVGIRF